MFKYIKIIIKKIINIFLVFIFLPIDYIKFIKLNDGRFNLKLLNFFPCLEDKTRLTGFEPHYIYHPAWAARVVAKLKPECHIDISSTLNFCTTVSAFCKVKFFDFRPANIILDNLEVSRADLTCLVFKDNSVDSLSCMHVVEHIGLGRYGDPIDPKGDLNAISELNRVISHGGSLLFVVPVGIKKIAFNAHRIYSYKQVLSYFPNFILKEFVLIPDNALEKGIIYNATEELVDKQKWGCGCFWLIKK